MKKVISQKKATSLFKTARDAVQRRMGPRRRYDDDPVWDALFARSQDVLIRLGEEALVEARAGLTKPLDPDML